MNVGTIGHSGHGKTTLTAAILKVQSKRNLAKAISYTEIAKGGKVHNETQIASVTTKDVEYERITQTALCAY